MNEGQFQHLVPQWYLRRFADRKKNIRRMNKDGSVDEVRRVKEIAGERDFYTFIEDGQRNDSFEHALMALDDAAANATRRIIENIQETSGRDVECAKVILDGLEGRDTEATSAGPDSHERSASRLA
jgi:hypothetical protein